MHVAGVVGRGRASLWLPPLAALRLVQGLTASPAASSGSKSLTVGPDTICSVNKGTAGTSVLSLSVLVLCTLFDLLMRASSAHFLNILNENSFL